MPKSPMTRQEAEQLLLSRFWRAHSDLLQAGYMTGRQLLSDASPAPSATASDWRRIAIQVNEDSVQLAGDIRAELTKFQLSDEGALSHPEALHTGDGSCAPTPAWLKLPPPHVVSAALREMPDQDPFSFPARYIADGRRLSYQLDALRTAADQEAAADQKQFLRWAVALGFLAVAGFLFGYSLTPHGVDHGAYYALAGMILVFGAITWGIYTLIRAPQSSSAGAMAAYADGRVALDRGESRLAVVYLSCVTRLDPAFGPAYEYLAQAENSLAQAQIPQGDENFFTEPPWVLALQISDYSKGISDAQQAASLDLKDPNLPAWQSNLADALLASGIRNHRSGDVAQAASVMASARQLDPKNAKLELNLAEAELVLNRPGWLTAMRSAAKLADPGAALGALSDLAYVGVSRFARSTRGRLASAQQDLIAVATQSTPSPGARVRAGSFGGAQPLSLSLSSGGYPTLSPGQVLLTIKNASLLKPGDHLYALWYERVPTPRWAAIRSGGVWQVDSGLSRPLPAATTVERFGLSKRCLGSGDYKVDMYVNGALAGETTQGIGSTQTYPTPVPDMNFSFCRPYRWSDPPDAMPGGVPGFVEGSVSPDRGHKSGLLVVDATGGPGRVCRRTSS